VIAPRHVFDEPAIGAQRADRARPVRPMKGAAFTNGAHRRPSSSACAKISSRIPGRAPFIEAGSYG
jgi:hypothetical protein